MRVRFNDKGFIFAATKPGEEDFVALMNDLLIAFTMGEEAPLHVCQRLCDHIDDHTVTYCGAQVLDTIMIPREDHDTYKETPKENIAFQAMKLGMREGAFTFKDEYPPCELDDWDGPAMPRKYVRGAVTVFLPNGKKENDEKEKSTY